MALTCPIVSIIVAAYNAEKYLNRCLDSIAAQTLEEWECIIVDDGSTDMTGILADEYVSQDSRFRVIHQKNGGVSSARQVGIDNSVGIYTIHVDSDDWVEPDMLEELVKCANDNQADMVICDFFEVYEDHVDYNCQKPTPCDRQSIWGLTFNTLSGALWNKLIKKACYLDWNISFENDINFEEDKLVCLKLLSHSISVTYLNKAFYHYDHFNNPCSLSNQWNTERRLLVLERIGRYCDVQPVQTYYDNAILYIAYHALSFPRSHCPNYITLFRKHLASIKRAKGFRWYTKILVLLRLNNITLPPPGRFRHSIHKLMALFYL